MKKTCPFTREEAVTALRTLLDAIEALPKPAANEPIELFTLSDYKPDKEFIRDPLGKTLRVGVQNIGQILSHYCTIEEAREICDDAAVPGSLNFGSRSDIVDKRWDGVVFLRGDVWLA